MNGWQMRCCGLPGFGPTRGPRSRPRHEHQPPKLRLRPVGGEAMGGDGLKGRRKAQTVAARARLGMVMAGRDHRGGGCPVSPSLAAIAKEWSTLHTTRPKPTTAPPPKKPQPPDLIPHVYLRTSAARARFGFGNPNGAFRMAKPRAQCYLRVILRAGCNSPPAV